MRLVDILSCYDVDESPPKIQQSLLHAVFASLLVAVELRHLLPAVGVGLLVATKAKWAEILSPPTDVEQDQHADFSGLSIENVWNETLAVLSRDDPEKFFQHLGTLAKPTSEEAVSRPKDVPLVSVQDVRMFKYWLRSAEPDAPSREGRLLEYTAADVMALIEACRDSSRLQVSPVVGRPKSVVWLTPLSGALAELLSRAHLTASGDADGRLEEMNFGYLARNRLGLWKKRSPDHGIALITRKTYESYLDELGGGIRAPTVLDAEGYDRFRHWPNSGTAQADELGRGRTYELDPRVRNMERPNDGAPEIIAMPRPLSEIASMIYLGPFGFPPGCSVDEERRSYFEFADEVSAGRTFEAIVTEIGATFNL